VLTCYSISQSKCYHAKIIHHLLLRAIHVVDEGGPSQLVGHAPPFMFVSTARIGVVILRPRPHEHLVALVFFCRWFIIVVISFAANSARITCIVRLLHLASCFSLFFFFIHLYYSTLSNFFLYLQRHLYRVSHHSSAC